MPNLKLHFPVYIIANRDGVAVVVTDGKDCIMLFHEREIAERQAELIESTHPELGSLHPLAVPNAGELREGLRSLPAEVTCAVWDPLGSPAKFNHMGVDDVLLAAESP
jgi:hypothetical protein